MKCQNPGARTDKPEAICPTNFGGIELYFVANSVAFRIYGDFAP